MVALCTGSILVNFMMLGKRSRSLWPKRWLKMTKIYCWKSKCRYSWNPIMSFDKLFHLIPDMFVCLILFIVNSHYKWDIRHIPNMNTSTTSKPKTIKLKSFCFEKKSWLCAKANRFYRNQKAETNNKLQGPWLQLIWASIWYNF